MKNSFSELGARFHQYLIDNKLSKADAARILGTSPTQVNNIIGGSKFGTDKLISIINAFPDIDKNWLLTGEYTQNVDPTPVLQISEEPSGSFNKRLKLVVESLFDGNVKALSNKAGLAYSTLNEYVLEKKFHPKTEMIEKIVSATENLNPGWLAFGEGEMKLKKELASGTKVPLINIEIEEFSIDRVHKLMTQSATYVNLPKLQSSHVITRTNTESLAPSINPGDYIGLRLENSSNLIIYGSVYAIQIDGVTLLRKIFNDPQDNDVLILRSNFENEYQDIRIKRKDVQRLAYVTGTISNL